MLGSKLVILRGVIGAFSTAAFYLSIAELGASRAVVLSLTYPIFATIIAAFWLKERASRVALLWMSAGTGLVLFLGALPPVPSPVGIGWRWPGRLARGSWW